MVRRNHWVFVGLCALGGAFVVASGLAGCREDTYRNTGSGGGGSDTVSSTTSASGAGGGTTTASVGAGGSGTGGGAPACDGQEVTVFDVTNDPNAANPVGPDIKVKVKGVVAMSQKFLVSKSSNTGSCLWGVFVSAPNLGKETTPYSGVLVVSYGNQATEQPPGSGTFFCSKLGVEPTGGAIPDDVKVGDELNVIGKTDYFLLAQCAMQMNGSTVKQRQISQACMVEKTGNQVLAPPAHTLTAVEIKDLVSPSNKAFHDMWGGVKLRIDGPFNVTTQMVMGMPSVLNGFGQFFLEGDNVQVGDKIYYRGYLKATDACFDGPKYTVPAQGQFVMNSVEGFSYLDFCTWSLSPNNKCTDLDPPSEDCAAGGPGGTPLMCP